ncbi:MAG: hypothetical protein IIA03_17220, partial [Proteobacteria bacterium]|nr:hypothetical protein [Pseudomonadota bacterium]
SVVLSNVVIGAEARLDRCIVGRQCYLGRGVMIGQAAVIGDGTTLAAGASVRAGVRIWPHKYVDAGVLVDRSLIHGRHARRTIFSHGGVAGLANAELTPEFAARLGAAWGSTLPLNASIVANRDNARPARMFKRALMAGLASVGVRVIDIGATPFPVARFAARLYQTVGGIHVRMSPYDPGSIEVRFLDPQGVDVSKSDERAIEALFTREDFRRVGSAAIAEITLSQPLAAYAEALLASVPSGDRPAVPLGVVVDYMGGSCGEVLPGLLARLGVRETAIDASPRDDGPNYQDVDTRLARLGRIVTAVEAAFGALLDADGNRVWIVDEQGRLLEELETIALMLRILHNAGRLGAVALPFTVPNSVARLAHELGFEPLRTKADVAEAMRAAHQHGAVLAANARRAFAFPPLHAGPDAMAAVVQVVQRLCAGDASVSGLMSRMPAFCVANAEVPVSWNERGAVMRALKSGDVQLLHAQQGLHHTLGGGHVGASHPARHLGRNDLPRQAMAVLEPAALTRRRVAALGQGAPVVVYLVLRIATDHQRDGLVEAEHGAAVERQKGLAFQLELHRHFRGTIVRPALELWLNQHVEYGKKLAELAIKAAQTRQRAGQKVEKRKGSGVAVLPGKLTDCESRDIGHNEVFLVEGDSAGGSAKMGRDKECQAILPLRGKVLNTWEVER